MSVNPCYQLYARMQHSVWIGYLIIAMAWAEVALDPGKWDEDSKKRFRALYDYEKGQYDEARREYEDRRCQEDHGGAEPPTYPPVDGTPMDPDF